MLEFGRSDPPKMHPALWFGTVVAVQHGSEVLTCLLFPSARRSRLTLTEETAKKEKLTKAL